MPTLVTINPKYGIGICAITFFCTACPSPNTAPLVISQVTVDGASSATEFDLFIEGRGFGLTSIRYSVQDKTGEALDTGYRVHVVDQLGQLHGLATGRQVELRSPNLIVATIQLRTPLEQGTYGVELALEDDASRPLRRLQEAFEVSDIGQEQDAGTPVGMDADPRPPVDGGVPDVDNGRDAGIVDRPPNADAMPNPVDVGMDAGVVDTGPVDSGLGPWLGNFRYRQQVMLTNRAANEAPAGVTVRVPVPHALLVAGQLAEPDGSDLALYLGANRLDTQWDDRLQIGANELALIAALPAPIAANASVNDPPLVLYYGDPAGGVPRTDDVFEFAERFSQNVPLGNNAWRSNQWIRQCSQRGGSGMEAGSYCVMDDTANPTRRTLASPTINALSDNPGPDVRYELSIWITGVMAQEQDVLYFSYSNNNQNLAGSTLLPESAYMGFVPTRSITFTETNNNQRMVTGWALPLAAPVAWMRSTARFVPTQQDQPSLHFRYVSANNRRDPDTLVAIDDFTVRRVMEPDFSVVLGPTDSR